MDKKINIITLGAAGVGKTSIINRMKEGKFDENVPTTIGMGFSTIIRPYNKRNMFIILNFQDTEGQEEYQEILPKQYIRDSHVVLLVFDSVDTLNALKKRWYTFYKENANIKNSKFILIGNKSDTFGNEREEIIRQGDLFSQEINSYFITCSAKSADNIDNLERMIITEARRFVDEEEEKKELQNNDIYNEQKENKIFYISDKDIGDEENCVSTCCYNAQKIMKMS